jgi:hypothetical protein
LSMKKRRLKKEDTPVLMGDVEIRLEMISS